MTYPVLYTFRRCPYAIRARMALDYADLIYEVREVLLRDKPSHMLAVSPKGTVPVLLHDDLILDESLDVVEWALSHDDPDGWLDWNTQTRTEMSSLVDECEQHFKPNLDRYKYSESAEDSLTYREASQEFLQELEDRLVNNSLVNKNNVFLFGDRLSAADVCVFPFVRQFAHVDKVWFDTTPFPHLQSWLTHLLCSALFLNAMKKYPQWCEGDDVTLSRAPVETP